MAFQHHHKKPPKNLSKTGQGDDIQTQNSCNLCKYSALLKGKLALLEDQDFRKLNKV